MPMTDLTAFHYRFWETAVWLAIAFPCFNIIIILIEVVLLKYVLI